MERPSYFLLVIDVIVVVSWILSGEGGKPNIFYNLLLPSLLYC